VRFGRHDDAGVRRFVAPIAPGLLNRVSVARHGLLNPGERIRVVAGAGTVAVDGEREIEFGHDDQVEVVLDSDGPRTVDVARTLHIAATRGLLDV